MACHDESVNLLLAAHESSMRHDTGYAHPERPQRLTATIEGIRTSGLDVVDVAPEPISRERLLAVHDAAFVDRLERFRAAGGGAIDMDTVASAYSWEAALRAAAAGPELVDRLEAGQGALGYVAMRPPGHHAEHARAMGFCLFNNIAVTAAYLTGRGNRVAIVDWDVHHGNGTQEMFYSDPAVLYLSIHQAGIYPGTGRLGELGEGPGEGTNLNLAVPAATTGLMHRRAVDEIFVPIIEEFEADWILVSAGYDAHRLDPLATLLLDSSDYGAMAQRLSQVDVAGGAVVFLEGGYDLGALERSARATVRGWLDPEYVPDPARNGIDPEPYLARTRGVAARYWRML
jgi:acetoin utilization deacetylase AcuC-like enzyme